MGRAFCLNYCYVSDLSVLERVLERLSKSMFFGMFVIYVEEQGGKRRKEGEKPAFYDGKNLQILNGESRNESVRTLYSRKSSRNLEFSREKWIDFSDQSITQNQPSKLCLWDETSNDLKS